MKQSGMLKSVLRAFQQVVQIPPPRIGRIKLSIEFDRAGERRLWIVPEHRHDVFSVLTPFAAYQNLVPDMAIVVVYRRWPGDFKLPDHYLAQGAEPAPVGVDVDAGATDLAGAA